MNLERSRPLTLQNTHRVNRLHTLSTNRFSFKKMWQIHLPALMYGSLLLLLLFRKKDDGNTGNTASMPSIIAPLLNYSLHISIILIGIMVLKTLSSRKLKLPPYYVIAYMFSIFFYNIRVFDTNDISRSLVGVFLPPLTLLLVSGSKNRDIQPLILREALTFCFASFSIINVILLILGFGYHGFRFSGVTFHPNQMGLVACLSSIYFIANTFNSPSLKARILNIGLLLLSGILLLASGSRGALLAATLGALFYLLIERKFFPIIITSVIAALTLSILSIISPENLSTSQSRMADGGDNRSDVWSEMFWAFINSPIIGMGPDAVGSESSILKAMAVGGIICGIPVLIMTLKIIKKSFKYFFNTYKNKSNSVYYSLLTCILIASLLDAYLFEKFGFTSLLLLLILCIIVDPPKNKKVFPKKPNPTSVDTSPLHNSY